MAVCGYLCTANDSTGTVLHEVHSPIRAASADQIRNHELGVSVDSHPRPNVTPADFLLRGANVFGLCADVCPYFIALETAHADIANMLIMELHAGRSKVDQEFGDRIAGNT